MTIDNNSMYYIKLVGYSSYIGHDVILKIILIFLSLITARLISQFSHCESIISWRYYFTFHSRPVVSLAVPMGLTNTVKFLRYQGRVYIANFTLGASDPDSDPTVHEFFRKRGKQTKKKN